MGTDIVTRLREWEYISDDDLIEAADEIERLREINRNLHTECDRMNAERRA